MHPKYWGIWFFAVILRLLVYLPVWLQFSIGAALGWLFYHLVPGRRSVTQTNIRLCFPKLSKQEQADLVKGIYRNTGIGLFETLIAWYRPKLLQGTLSVEGEAGLLAAIGQNRGVLIVGGHYTALELAVNLAHPFVQAAGVYRPQNNPLLELLISHGRSTNFVDQIPARDIRKCIRHLNSGGQIWYTPDQDMGLKFGVMSEFFGVSAATLTAHRRIASISKCEVLMAHFCRTKEASFLSPKPSYQMTFTPVLKDYPSKDEAVDAKRSNQMLESLISLAPDQYMWFHKRFKTQPDRPNPYKDPDFDAMQP